MDQVVLDALESGQWRGCRRGWDGRPLADLSLPCQTHHDHVQRVGWYFRDLPAYAVSAIEVCSCSWHRTKTWNSSWAVERAEGVERSPPFTPITVIHVINYLQGGNSKVQT